MLDKPYPEYPPQYRVVTKVGEYDRTCMVLEVLSLGSLSPTQLAQIREQVELAIHKIPGVGSIVEGLQIVGFERFDAPLAAALRLPRS
jgi:hypothetical protein